jgi:hypothetical protein
MKPLIESEIFRKFYVHFIASFALGFMLFLWGYGFYGMISTFKVYLKLPYIMLMFTVFFIFFSVFLEHRGVQMPYLLVGGALLSIASTFISVCIVNGAMLIRDGGFPPLDSFLIMFSVSTLAAFVVIKLVTMGR